MIRVFVVDRLRVICDVLASALGRQPGLQMAGFATGFDETAAALPDAACDVLLLNANLPDGAALQLTEHLRHELPGVQVLVFGMADSQPIILRYIEAGVAGYALADESFAELVEHIVAVHNQQALVAPEVAAVLMDRIADLSDKLSNVGIRPGHYEELTEREREILGLVAQGLSNQEIAEQLVIGLGTVKNHVHNIFEKLHVNNRQDAAIFLSLLQAQQNEEKPLS
jgi:DNA-binding NarL/FixJ family response regulator